MNVRVTQFGSETEPDSNDSPAHLDSDSSFEQRMRAHVTRQQGQTCRNVHAHRLNDVAMGDFDRRPKSELSSRVGLREGQDVPSAKMSPSRRERRRLNRSLEDFDRSGSIKGKSRYAMENQVKDKARTSIDNKSAVPDLFSRFNRVRNGITPRIRQKENFLWDEAGADHVLPSVEDSPLSRKSIGRGTPGAADVDRSQALDRVLSWNIEDDFNEQSMLISTPAIPRKRPTLAEIKQAELEASALRGTILDQGSDLSDREIAELGALANGQQSRKEIEISPRRPKRNGRGGALLTSTKVNAEGAPAVNGVGTHTSEDELFLTLPEVSIVDDTIAARVRDKENRSHQDSRPAFIKDELHADHLGNRTVPALNSQRPPNRRALGDIGSQSPSGPGRSRRNGLDGVTQTRNRAANADVDDSINVLRRLSRSVSGTPTPQKPVAEREQQPVENLTANQRPSRLMNPQIRDEGEELPAVLQDELHAQQAFSSLKPQTTAMDTPRVTGGWIQTPMIKSKQFSISSGAKIELEPPSAKDVLVNPAVASPKQGAQDSKHSLPASALSTVVDNARSKAWPDKGRDGFGDSTINSLEDLMEQLSNDEDLWDISQLDIPAGPGMMSVEDRTAIIELLEERIAQELPYSNGLAPSPEEKRLIREIVEQRVTRGLGPSKSSESQQRQQQQSSEDTQTSMRDDGGPRSPMTPRRKGRLLEELQLQRMSEHVNSMHSRTRSLSKGLGRIERKLVDAGECTHEMCNGNCFDAHPVSAYGNVFKRLLVQRKADGPRLTRLGWMLSTIMLWLSVEIAIWYMNTPPLFSEHNPTPFATHYTGPPPPFYFIYAIASFLASPLEYSAFIAKGFWVSISTFVQGLARQRALYAPAPHTAVIGDTAAGYAAQSTRAVWENAADYSMDNDVIL